MPLICTYRSRWAHKTQSHSQSIYLKVFFQLCAHTCKHYLAPSLTCPLSPLHSLSQATKLEENVAVNFFFPRLYRTCRRVSKQLFGVGVSPEDEVAIMQVICPLGRTYHLLLTVGKIARRKREYLKLQLQDDTNFSWTQQYNNTETLQNKQLYSNQDAIYREQTATLH